MYNLLASIMYFYDYANARVLARDLLEIAGVRQSPSMLSSQVLSRQNDQATYIQDGLQPCYTEHKRSMCMGYPENKAKMSTEKLSRNPMAT